MSDSFEEIALHQSIIRKQWLPLDVAVQEVLAFEQHFGTPHFLLACHAALPSLLTPELLHSIRLNFLDQQPPRPPWIAEMDLLLSSLCRPIDQDWFEVEPMVREALLYTLQERYGRQRLQDVSAFLLQYLHKTHQRKRNASIAQLHEWIAQAYLQPDKVVQELAHLLSESVDLQSDEYQTLPKKLQVARTMELLAEPLGRTLLQEEYQGLLHSARVLAYSLYGNRQALSTTPPLPGLSSNQRSVLFPPAVQQWLNTLAPPATVLETVPAANAEVMEEVPEAQENWLDQQLRLAGWVVQEKDDIDVRATPGIAIRDFSGNTSALPTGHVDYLLVVDSEAVGVIELVDDHQEYRSESSVSIPLIPRFIRSPLPFSYEVDGREIVFTNNLEPEARSRPVFHFHQPQTFAEWLKQAPVGRPNELNDLLRSRLRRMPAIPREGLHEWQFETITNLEQSFAQNRSRALIQMATGSGKTYMAVSSIYRLLKYGNAKRILFLIDRTILATQAFNQFQQYITPDSGRKFADLYNVQHLVDSNFDSTVEVCIVTVQWLYSLLRSRRFEREDESLLEKNGGSPNKQEELHVVHYNPAIPIEYFDVIFIDECQRSIYAAWRPMLEYFDAFLIGLTATFDSRAFAFFNNNIVYEYTMQQAVKDRVSVSYRVYRLETEITEQDYLFEQIEDNLEDISKNWLFSHDIVSSAAIRQVIAHYKDVLFTELFPERQIVPKTVIIAKNERQVDDIIQAIKEVFQQGNDFVKKITGRVKKPETLIQQFRSSYNPRIVVTINMLLTGVDIKPVEVIFLMRSVQSRAGYEQMVGLGCRAIADDELKMVTPDATNKEHCVVIDPVGITDYFELKELFIKASSSIINSGYVDYRFTDWLTAREYLAEKPLTPEQITWLERIRKSIATTNLKFEEENFNRPPFILYGGLAAARFLFGKDLPGILQELNELLLREA